MFGSIQFSESFHFQDFYTKYPTANFKFSAHKIATIHANRTHTGPAKYGSWSQRINWSTDSQQPVRGWKASCGSEAACLRNRPTGLHIYLFSMGAAFPV